MALCPHPHPIQAIPRRLGGHRPTRRVAATVLLLGAKRAGRSAGRSAGLSVGWSVGWSVDGLWGGLRGGLWDGLRGDLRGGLWDGLRDGLWDSLWDLAAWVKGCWLRAPICTYSSRTFIFSPFLKDKSSGWMPS